MLRDLCRAGMDCVSSEPGPEKRAGYKELVVSILAFIIAMFIIAFIGRFLWNNSVVQLFTCVRPVHSVWQIIALLLLVSLFK
jgi:hypothetical protein